MICPNCKYESEEEVVRCPQCGNPLIEGKPWEKGALLREEKPQFDEEAEDESLGELKVRYQHRERGKFARYMATQEREWSLQSEFVVHVGYCCYNRDPEDMEELKEGTALLSKTNLYFGDSEHNLRCGKFDVCIPVELVDYFTNIIYRGKTALVIHVKTGERFILFAMKNKEWIEKLGYLMEYRPTDHPEKLLQSEKKSSNSSVGKIIFHLIAAIVMFAMAGFLRADTFMMTLFIIMGAGFLLLVALGIFGPKKN
jgi:hypothetical protein